MKKSIWLKPGKQLNSGAIVGGIGFALYLVLSALEWRTAALIVYWLWYRGGVHLFLRRGLPGKGQGLCKL